jgi:hypothetical protein
MEKSIIKFFVLLLMTIGMTYYVPVFFQTVFYITLLIAYWKSDNEPFWLAFFLVVSDGVFGFFGRYDVAMQLLPGLPAIEVSQLYIGLTILKASEKKQSFKPFFNGFLIILLIYSIFLVVQGQVLGLSKSLNVQFRVVKQLLPMALFFSIPRLMDKEDDYFNCFKYLFPVAILAFGAQIFTILVKTSPPEYFGAKEETRHKILINLVVTADRKYRGIYNEGILIITYFGALYSLVRNTIKFSKAYIYLVIISIFFTYFISATRGYVLGFFLILLPFVLFIMKLNAKHIVVISALATVTLIGVASIPVMSIQFEHSLNRMYTMEALLAGDTSAGGTLKRLDVRGPRVMKKWRESPLTGWGFSNAYIKHEDMHVGNQTILLHSGIIGALLMGLFFFYFNAKLFFKGLGLPGDHESKKALMVFGIFFFGWFAIHSSTQYYFSYCLTPSLAMIQVLFFSLGGILYHKSFNKNLPE